MKPIYKVLDAQGRVYIPQELRESAGVGSGDVLELRAGKGKITLIKSKVVAPEPPTVDDILEMLQAVPKAALLETTAKLMAILGGADETP